MNPEKNTFTRTFLEASLPTWLALAGLMFFSRGILEENYGLLSLLALAFPGIWGALRLSSSAESWLRRILAYAAFYLAHGIGTVIVLFVARLTLHALGLYDGDVNNLPGAALLLGVIPGAIFAVLRGIMAIPDAIRFLWERRVLLARRVGLVAVLASLTGAGYLLVRQPYAAHASWTEPNIVENSLLANFNQDASGWRTSTPNVNMRFNGETLHLDVAGPTLVYTFTWSVQPGRLTTADGFQFQARSDAATYITVEVKEAQGGKYRSWADLPSGDWKTLCLTEFLPSLDTLDENGKLDWEKIEEVNFYVLNYGGTDSDLWLDNFETIKIDHSKETPWLEASSEHFWIRYHASDQSTLADVQKAAEENIERISAILGFLPHARVPITIVSNHAELELQVGGARPVWVNGVALPESLVILTPLRFSPIFNKHQYEDVFEVIPHEFSHLLIMQIMGYTGSQEMPLWLHEGLPVYLANQHIDEQAMREAAKQGKLPSLQELEMSFSRQAPIGDSYSTAGSVTRYLIETYGADKIPLLLQTMAKGVDFDSALRQVIGIDSDTFEQGWQDMFVADRG